MNNFNGLPKQSNETNFTNQEDKFLFSRKLREHREKSKKLLTDLIDIFDLTKSSLYAWESGTAFPSRDKLSKIAFAYGIEGRDYHDLIRAFEISKNARKNEKVVIKPKIKPSVRPLDPLARNRRVFPKSGTR